MLRSYHRVVLVIIALTLGVIFVPASNDVTAQPAPVEVTQLCRNIYSTQLRYIAPYQSCLPGSEVAVDLLDGNSHTLCVNYSTRAMRMPIWGGCGAREFTVTLPDDLPIFFCINAQTGRLRYLFAPTGCGPNEFTGTVNQPPPVAEDDAYDSLGNVGVDVANAVDGLFANDTLEGGTLDSFQNPSANGGVVQVNADGTFDYTPPLGFEGSDTFTYTISNPGGSDSATVTISVTEVIWFIDDSAPGPGDGTIADPFSTIANFNGAPDDPGDTIFVYEGNYTDAFAGLQDDQLLIGQGVDLLTVTGFVLPPFSRPLPGPTADPFISLNGSAGSLVPIASGNLITGLWLDGATNGIAGLGGATGTTVDRVGFSNMSANGVVITPATNTTITNVTFQTNNTDIRLNADTTVIQDVVSNATVTGISIANITNTLLIERVDINGTDDVAIVLDAAQSGSVSTINDVTIDGNGASGDAFRVTNSVASSSFDINNLDIGGTTGVTGDSLEFIDNAGTFDFDAASSVTHDDNASIVFSSDGDSGTLTYNGDITATAGQFIQVLNDTGTKTFQTGTLNASGTDNAFFSNANGFYNFLGTMTMTGTSDGFVIFGSDGDFTMNANTSIANPTLDFGIRVQGGDADLDYSGSVDVDAAGVSVVNVDGGHTGTITFQPASTLNATDGNGLFFDDADGTYNFNGTTTLNGGDAGIDILGNSNGTFTFGPSTSITNPTGDAFNVTGDGTNSPIITYGGTMANNANDVIEITDTVGPNTITFDSAAADAIQDSGTGIFLNNTGQAVNFTTDIELTGAEGIDIDGGSGTFTFTDTDIANTSAAPAVDVNGGTSTFSFQAFSSIIQNQNQSAFSVSNGHAGGASIFSGTINATNGDGLQFDSALGSQYNFNGITTLNGGDAGVDIVNGSSGSFTFGNLTVTTPSTGPGVNITGGTTFSTFSRLDIDTNGTIGFNVDGAARVNVGPLAATVDSVNAAALDLANTGLGMTFTGVSSTNSPIEGIDIDNINAGSTFTIDDGNAGTVSDATISNSANSGIDIDNSAGVFTFAAVDIDTTGADGVNLGTNAATVNINGGEIDDTNTDGVNATSTSIAVDAVNIGQNTVAGGRGLFVNAAGTGPFTAALSNLNVNATDHAVKSTDGGTATALVANIDNSTFETLTGVPTVEMTGGGLNSTVVTSLNADTVTANGTSGGLLFDQITFDASGAALSGTQATATGTTNIGQSTAAAQRAQGDGLSMLNPTGDLGFTTLNIFNNAGTGLEVDTKGLGTTFNLASGGGTVDTIGGPALFLDPLTTAMTLDTVVSDASTTGASISNGTGVTLDQVAGTLAITTLTVTNSAAEGLFVNASTGTFTINGGSITGANGAAVRVDNIGAADTSTLTYDGAITNTSNRSVQIEDKTGGAVNLGGLINDTGTGVLVQNNSGGTAVDFDGATKTLNTGANQAVTLTSNSGATVSFTNGGLDIDTSGGANGFNATGGGTVNVTGSDNTVDTTAGTGTAVNISSTDIGASNMTFLSVNVDGAPSGIVLSTTGSAGSLIVTGDGGTTNGGNGTAGTIDNTTGAGISLTSTLNPTFRNMTIEDTGNHGIYSPSGVNGLTLQYSTVQRAGNGNDEHGVHLINATGTVLIDNVFMTLAANDLIQILNTNSNATVTVSNSSLQETDGSGGLFGNDAISLQVQGTSVVTLNVNNNIFGQASDGIFGNAVDIGNAIPGGITPASGTVNFNASGSSSIENAADLFKGGGFKVSGQDSLTINLDLTGNTFNGAKGNGVISVDANDSSTVQGNIGGAGAGNVNTITNATNSNGITVLGDESANVIVVVENNSLTSIGTDGIQVANFGSSLGDPTEMDVTLRGNVINGHNVGSAPFFAGIDIFGGGAAGGHTCINMDNNSVNGTPGGFFDYALDDFGASGGMLIQGPGAAAVTETDIQNLNNQPGASVSLFGAINFSNGVACLAP